MYFSPPLSVISESPYFDRFCDNAEETESIITSATSVSEDEGTECNKTCATDTCSSEVPEDKYLLASVWMLLVIPPEEAQLGGYELLPTYSADGDYGHLAAKRKEGEIVYKLSEIRSIEAFWRTYNNCPQPSSMRPATDLCLFRAGITPFVEDPKNDGGGKWSFQLAQRKAKEKVDKMWLYTLLAVIGETFEPLTDDMKKGNEDFLAGGGLSSLVNGASISIRDNFFLITLWIKSAPEEYFTSTAGLASIRNLGVQFKTHVLGYTEAQTINAGNVGYCSEVEFQRHQTGKSKKALRQTRFSI